MAGPVTDLVVPKIVERMWLPGAQVFVTSQSTAWDHQDIRTIKTVKNHNSTSVVLTLDTPLPNPMTKQDGDLPVEVALLSRNIVMNGGHLTVYRTPAVVQTIHGVRFQNLQLMEEAYDDRSVSIFLFEVLVLNFTFLTAFEQMSLFQKPIRIFQSKSIAGTSITGNTIFDSKHGCIFVESTDDLTITSNVALQTSGHCFVLQTGMERGIAIRRNLGAQTRQSTGVDAPSTFAIANPADNMVEDNVAAGSQGTGFSLFSKDKSLSWKNNRAHSNRLGGIAIEVAFSSISNAHVTLQGLHSYRNLGPGLLIDVEDGLLASLLVQSSTLSDNRGGIVLGGIIDELSLQNLTLIGQSASLQLADTLSTEDPFCEGGTSYAAIQLPSSTNVEIQGVLVEDFHPTDDLAGGHCMSHIVKVDTNNAGTLYGEINLSKITGSSSLSVDFCKLPTNSDVDVQMFAVQQEDEPDHSWPSILVPDGHSALSFIPSSSLTKNPESCAQLLIDTCVRTVEFDIDPKYAAAANLVLKICDRVNTPLCNTYKPVDGTASADGLFPMALRKFFVVTLPQGRYEATLIHATTGERLWPTFVQQTWHDVSCKGTSGGYLEQDGSIWLPIPPPKDGECLDNLLRSEPEPFAATTYSKFWLGSLQILPTVPTLICEVPSGPWAPDPYILGQYLDPRCLLELQEYRVTFNIRLQSQNNATVMAEEGQVAPYDAVNSTVTNSSLSGCTTDSASCPFEAGILFTSHDGRVNWIHPLEYVSPSASTGEGTGSVNSFTGPDQGILEASQSTNVSSTRTNRIGSTLNRPRRVDFPDKAGEEDSLDESHDPNQRRMTLGANDDQDEESSAPAQTETETLMSDVISTSDSPALTFSSTLSLDKDMAEASSAFFFIRRRTSMLPLCVDSLSIIRAK
jgi:Right handed beta helix region